MSRKASQEVDLTAVGCIDLGIRLGLLAAMFISVGYCLLLFVAQFLSGSLHQTLDKHSSILAPLLAYLRSAMDPRLLRLDVAPLAAGLVCFLAWVVLASVLGGIAEMNRPQREDEGASPQPVGAARELPRSPVRQGVASGSLEPPLSAANHLELLQRVAGYKKQIERATGKEREELLAQIADAQKALAAHKRSLAFVSLDVVGSTKMKASQQSAIVEHAFLAFRNWADGVMKRHAVWKSSWTPDGCMAAFKELDQAVFAARELLRELPQFNRGGHEMDAPFQIRLGVSHGQVLFAESFRMDEVSDQVIDLAGHLQKYAMPDSLLITKRDLSKLKESRGFLTTHSQVDGFDTLEWRA